MPITATIPARIKITRPEGPNRFAVMDGIYDLDGDRLKICMGEPEEKVMEFKRAGKTMLVVSHNPAVVNQLCDRALWLDRGELVMEGSADEVLQLYEGRSTTSSRK